MLAFAVFRNSIIFILVLSFLLPCVPAAEPVLKDMGEAVTVMGGVAVDTQSTVIQKGVSQLLMAQLCMHLLASPLPALSVLYWTRPPNEDEAAARYYRSVTEDGTPKFLGRVMAASMVTMILTVLIQQSRTGFFLFKPLARVLEEERYGLNQIGRLVDWAEDRPIVRDPLIADFRSFLRQYSSLESTEQLKLKVREWLASTPGMEFERKVESVLRERDRVFPQLREGASSLQWFVGAQGESGAEAMNGLRMDFLLLDSLHAFLKRGMPEPIHWEKERAALRAQLVRGQL